MFDLQQRFKYEELEVPIDYSKIIKETYGVEICFLPEEVQDILRLFVQHGSSNAIMMYLSKLQKVQQVGEFVPTITES